MKSSVKMYVIEFSFDNLGFHASVIKNDPYVVQADRFIFFKDV